MKDLFGNEKMLALSWKQPFAELMLHGKIETRVWSTNYRGLVLICASKKGYGLEECFNIAGNNQMVRITNVLGRNNDHFLNNYQAGIAIAVGRLVNCRPMKKEDENLAFVEYYPDLFCHVYENVKAIKPFEWKGCQGWKKVEQNIIDQIEFL
jgi:hypothetical protein